MELIAALTAIEITLFIFAYFGNQNILRQIIVINMLSFFLRARILADYGIGSSNIGSLFFGFVYPAQGLLFYRFGINSNIETIKVTVFTLFGVWCLTTLTLYHADSALNSELTEILKYFEFIRSSSFSAILGVILSFFISMNLFLLILVINFFNEQWKNYLLAATLSQILDCFLFFFVVFGNQAKWLEFGVIGFVVRLFINTAFVPLFLRKIELKDE